MDIAAGAIGASCHDADHGVWVGRDETYYRSDALALCDVFLARYGIDCRPILRDSGISQKALGTSNLFISWPRYCRFLEVAAQESGDPDYGLQHALFMPKDFPNCGPLLPLSHLCRTFREWIEVASRYGWVHTNAWAPYLSMDRSGQAIFRISENPSTRMPRHVAEGMLLVLLRCAREVSGQPDMQPTFVRFRHARPADTALHHSAFGCPVEFDALHNEFVFDPGYLDIPLSGTLAKFRFFVDVFIKREIRRAVKGYDRFSVAVAHVIPAVLGTDFLAAGSVASALGVSEKKMQRLLQMEGTSFQKIASDVRKQIALTLLGTTEVPVKAIGGYLGYGSNSAFTLAFTQWTGSTPSAYRKSRPAQLADAAAPPSQ